MIQFKTNKWFGLDCIDMRVGEYKARIIPSLGGNLMELIHLEGQVKIFKNPYYQGLMNKVFTKKQDKSLLLGKEGIAFFSKYHQWTIEELSIIDNKQIKFVLTYHNKRNIAKQISQFNGLRIIYLLDKNGLIRQFEVNNISNTSHVIGMGTRLNLFFHAQCQKKYLRLRVLSNICENNNEKLCVNPFDEQKQKDVYDHPMLVTGATVEDIKLKKRICYEVDKQWSQLYLEKRKQLCILPITDRDNDYESAQIKEREDTFLITSRWSYEVF